MVFSVSIYLFHYLSRDYALVESSAPIFDLHWRVAAKRAVFEVNVADIPVAAVAVWDRPDAGAMPVGEVDVLNKHL